MYFPEPIFQHILAYVGDLKQEQQKKHHVCVMEELKALGADWEEWNTVAKTVDFLFYIEWYRYICPYQFEIFEMEDI